MMPNQHLHQWLIEQEAYLNSLVNNLDALRALSKRKRDTLIGEIKKILEENIPQDKKDEKLKEFFKILPNLNTLQKLQKLYGSAYFAVILDCLLDLNDRHADFLKDLWADKDSRSRLEHTVPSQKEYQQLVTLLTRNHEGTPAEKDRFTQDAIASIYRILLQPISEENQKNRTSKLLAFLKQAQHWPTSTITMPSLLLQRHLERMLLGWRSPFPCHLTAAPIIVPVFYQGRIYDAITFFEAVRCESLTFQDQRGGQQTLTIDHLLHPENHPELRVQQPAALDEFTDSFIQACNMNGEYQTEFSTSGDLDNSIHALYHEPMFQTSHLDSPTCEVLISRKQYRATITDIRYRKTFRKHPIDSEEKLCGASISQQHPFFSRLHIETKATHGTIDLKRTYKDFKQNEAQTLLQLQRPKPIDWQDSWFKDFLKGEGGRPLTRYKKHNIITVQLCALPVLLSPMLLLLLLEPCFTASLIIIQSAFLTAIFVKTAMFYFREHMTPIDEPDAFENRLFKHPLLSLLFFIMIILYKLLTFCLFYILMCAATLISLAWIPAPDSLLFNYILPFLVLFYVQCIAIFNTTVADIFSDVATNTTVYLAHTLWTIPAYLASVLSNLNVTSTFRRYTIQAIRLTTFIAACTAVCGLSITPTLLLLSPLQLAGDAQILVYAIVFSTIAPMLTGFSFVQLNFLSLLSSYWHTNDNNTREQVHQHGLNQLIVLGLCCGFSASLIAYGFPPRETGLLGALTFQAVNAFQNLTIWSCMMRRDPGPDPASSPEINKPISLNFCQERFEQAHTSVQKPLIVSPAAQPHLAPNPSQPLTPKPTVARPSCVLV